MNNFEKYLQWIDLSGGGWMGLSTLVFLVWTIAIAVWNFTHPQAKMDIPNGPLVFYGSILTAFAGSSIAGLVTGPKPPQPPGGTP